MYKTNTLAKDTAVLIFCAALCLTFFVTGFTPAHAEEDTVEAVTTSEEVVAEDDGEVTPEEIKKRGELMKQVESLRAMIAERKEAMEKERTEKVEEHKEMIEVKKVEFKADKVSFMETLEGLDEEAKKVAMMEFIQNLRTLIEAKQTEMQVHVDEQKAVHQEIQTERKEDQDGFKVSLETLTKDEKIAAILARVNDIKAMIEANKKADTEEVNDEDAEHLVSDDEETDESEEEVEAEDEV